MNLQQKYETKSRIQKKTLKLVLKFLKLEPLYNEETKKTEIIQITHLNTINKINVNNNVAHKIAKIPNYNNNIISKPNQRNISPFSNQQIIFNVKTKIEKKGLLNSSDIPFEKTYNNVDKNNSKNKHHYSKSIDSKENIDTHLSTTTNVQIKNQNKSPLVMSNYKPK